MASPEHCCAGRLGTRWHAPIARDKTPPSLFEGDDSLLTVNRDTHKDWQWPTGDLSDVSGQNLPAHQHPLPRE